MENITADFGKLYHPVKALVVYRSEGADSNCYVEAFDMDEDGFMVNAHPLATTESRALAKALDVSDALKKAFLRPKGLMPSNVLYINPEQNGFAIWHTPPMSANLFFAPQLDIPNGTANLPHLLWVAAKSGLQVFALKDTDQPTLDTELYHAPFFNLYKNGKVCMGTVKVKVNEHSYLEEFMSQWQEYFFNSYFSHHIGGHQPTKKNLRTLWKGLMNTKKKFPQSALLQTKFTLKDLLK